MLYRFQIELSDIDRNIYETLDFRITQHPSETATYLLTRALAYALSYSKELEFTAQGLSDPDGAALQSLGAQGGIHLWIEIGNPSARKLHKATKVAQQVVVYTYKNPDLLIAEIKANDVHKANTIQIFSFDPKFLLSLESGLEKNNRWSVLFQDGHLSVEIGSQSHTTDVKESKVENK
ncbi:MAG: YaeQ family protein [Bdellovibrionales bacterium]